MNRHVVLAAVLAVGGCGLAFSQAAKPAGNKSSQPSERVSGDLVARGKYIVDGVAVCSQCHTPRDSQGAPDRARWLEGAPLWLQSAEPVANWPLQAPRIAGAPPATDEELVTLLTTGIWTSGTFLRPPMPQFRMSRQDAEAVVAYLKSLTPMPK